MFSTFANCQLVRMKRFSNFRLFFQRICKVERVKSSRIAAPKRCEIERLNFFFFFAGIELWPLSIIYFSTQQFDGFEKTTTRYH